MWHNVPFHVPPAIYGFCLISFALMFLSFCFSKCNLCSMQLSDLSSCMSVWAWHDKKKPKILTLKCSYNLFSIESFNSVCWMQSHYLDFFMYTSLYLKPEIWNLRCQTLTHSYRETNKRIIGKECRPKADTTSWSTLLLNRLSKIE